MNSPREKYSDLPSANPSKWLRSFQREHDNAAPLLICLPHAGGSASSFVGLSKRLAPSVHVIAAQYPGRQDRMAEACSDDLREMATAIYSTLSQFDGRAIAIFGHSMGALVGFELALRFEHEGDGRLIGFIPSGHRAPSEPRSLPLPDRDEDILEEAMALGGSTVLRESQVADLALPALRADYQAVARYEHRPTTGLGCRMTACVGDADPLTSIEAAQAWQLHSSGHFELRVFRGGHFYLKEGEEELARTLTSVVTRWSSALDPGGVSD